MGHREDLLEGAKRCLLEKGFVRTTARDIVKESGTNLGLHRVPLRLEGRAARASVHRAGRADG